MPVADFVGRYYIRLDCGDYIKIQKTLRKGRGVVINEHTLRESLPRVSVVTVVFNGVNHIRSTIESVLAQTYLNIEYIMIDGGSVDGTMDVILEYGSKISYVQSESDEGIYDAMNKGIAMATGAWLNFMNAGDSFYSENSVSSAMAGNVDGGVVLYGAVEVRYPKFSRVEQPGDVSRLWSGMKFSHQSAFLSADYHKSHLYDLKYPITSDLHFMYVAYKSGQKFIRLNQVVASVVTGGVSEASRVRTIWAAYGAISAGKFRPLLFTAYAFQILETMLRSMGKKILPDRLVQKIILWK
jgi:glycosyltransferase involved in cell wall biosynthesis